MKVCPGEERRIHLSQLLPQIEFPVGEDIFTGRCTCDSRRVRPGDLFVAMVGEKDDGNRHVRQAISRGCSAILTDQPIDMGTIENWEVPVAIVPDAREAFARICQKWAGDPSESLSVIGITGTNGKTTTSCLIAGILAQCGHRLGMLGTLGYTDGRKLSDARWTTPPANVSADWLARMVKNECEYAVMEVSSHSLAQQRVAGIRFEAACLTNITGDHIDFHGTFDAYLAAKVKLFHMLPAEAVAIVNVDDPVAADVASRIDRPMLTVGIDSPADITAQIIEQTSSEQTFLLIAGNEAAAVHSRMIGRHHISNCLVAAALGLTRGFSLTDIASGLESVDYVPGRLESVVCGQPFRVYVDYAHTPDALTRSLSTLRSVTPGRLICVFGAGGDRDRSKRPLLAQAARAGADLAIVTTDNPRNEDPQAIIDEVLDGWDGPRSQIINIVDRREAIQWALSEAGEDDSVLIAGKGHETSQIAGRKRIPFSDVEVAREWLHEIAPAMDWGTDDFIF